MVPPRKDDTPLLLGVEELSLKRCFFTVAGYGNRGRRQQEKAKHGGGFCEGRRRLAVIWGPQGESDFLLRMFFHWESDGRM